MADALKQSSKRGSGYAVRFVFAYALVFAVFGGVIALFAVLVSGSKALASRSAPANRIRTGCKSPQHPASSTLRDASISAFQSSKLQAIS